MYITYETAQYSSIHKKEYRRRSQPPITIPNELPKPDFMPTKLVRISDMKVVDGSQVNEGYCALSYSWDQSGDIQQDDNGKYVRVDDGKHKIISYDGIFPDMIIPRYKTPVVYNYRIIERGSKLEKMYYVLKIIDDENYYFSKTIQYVKFEVIIQQICQQFNIKYIWYDQMCINQDDKKEKQHEMRNMHQIYQNAYCTVAFIPDHSHKKHLYASRQQYFRHIWTLEEVINSERLLLVGGDKHEWGDQIGTHREVSIFLKPLLQKNVSHILYHAHQRTSTNEHDRVFALIQLFPEFMDKIKIDYDQPFEDLMIQFYGLLAKKDISILFLGNNPYYKSTIEKYKFLPSWTGVNNVHLTYDITTSFQNYDIIGKIMHVTPTYVTNNQSIDDDNLTIREEDIPPIPDYIIDGDNDDFYHLCILVQLSKAKEMKRIGLVYYGRSWKFAGISFFDKISEKLRQLSRFMEIKKENLCWCNIDDMENDDYPMIANNVFFDYLTESLDDPSVQYVILSEISFESKGYNVWSYPVIKKKQGEKYYKVIGCCRIESNKDFFSDCNLPKQTFLIQ